MAGVLILLLVFFVWLAAQRRKSWPRWVLAAALVLSVISLVQVIGDNGVQFDSGIEVISCALTAGLNWYRANIKPLRPPRAPNVTAPTMGVWGSKDPALGEKQMRESANFVDGPFRFERVETGHWMMLTRPDEINALLLDFLRTP